MSAISRRRLLQGGASLGALAVAGAGLGCAGPVQHWPNPAFLRTPRAATPGRAALGWSCRWDAAEACQQLVAELGGLPWLGRGDSVLVKVACNSGNAHPAVTAAEAVESVVRLLRAHGAGSVVVADQAGVEHVRLTAEGRQGSTRELMRGNGLLDAAARAGAEVHCFEEEGWAGYQQASADFEHHWSTSPWLAAILERADHVVVLPRLGAHALAGVSLGAKAAVGWLRDDSRRHLHQRGDSFYEQIAELNLMAPLRDKLRLVLTVGRRALLDIGPDFGSDVDLEGVLALGATNVLDHDAVGTALLRWLDESVASGFDGYSPFPEDVDFWNRRLVTEVWGPEAARDYRPLRASSPDRGLAFDRTLSHLCALRGVRPSRIAVTRVGAPWPDGLASFLARQDDGLFAV